MSIIEKSIKELNQDEIYQLLDKLNSESRITNDIKRLEEIIEYKTLLYQVAKKLKD